MNDDELRAAIVQELRVNSTSGADGQPLAISDANLVTRLGADIDQLNRVLASLMEDGIVHGVPAPKVITVAERAEWDQLRLAENPLPPAERP